MSTLRPEAAADAPPPGREAASPRETGAPGQDEDRLPRGRALLAQVMGEGRAPHLDAVDTIAPDLARYAVEFAYGDIYARGVLSPAQRQLVTIGALVAIGDAGPQLAAHLGAALNVGLTAAEVVEAVIQVVPFAGFPRALNAMALAEQAIADRQAVLEDISRP